MFGPISRKHCRHSFIPYLLINPRLLPQLRHFFKAIPQDRFLDMLNLMNLAFFTGLAFNCLKAFLASLVVILLI